jgi:hypothetical protein
VSETELPFKYDPMSNPRSLQAPEDPERVAQLQDEYDTLRKKQDLYNAQKAMFKSRAWQALAYELEMEIAAARDALETPGRVKPESLGAVQAQIAAVKRLLNLPQLTENRAKAVRAELQNFRRWTSPEVVRD